MKYYSPVEGEDEEVDGLDSAGEDEDDGVDAAVDVRSSEAGMAPPEVPTITWVSLLVLAMLRLGTDRS